MSLKGVIATGFFRTGSTFFFSSLREIADFRCYYEPYHPELLEFVEKLGDNDGGPDQEALGHSVGDDYFAEFKDLDFIELSRVFCLQKRITNQPVLLRQSVNSDLRNYINFLSTHAYSQQQIPLLQANRFNFALPWLKHTFPNYLLVLITRDPQAVFKSLKALAKREGIELNAEDNKGDYWNVNEAFKNIICHYGFEIQHQGQFGYYQKLYFIILFSEKVMAEHADIVVEYEHFLLKPDAVIKTMTKGFGLDPSPAINYVKKNAKIAGKTTRDAILDGLEQKIKPLLNQVSKKAFSL